MQRWKISVVEPSLDDLLGDEMMIPVMRSAGVNAEDLRAELRKTACRLARGTVGDRGEKASCWAAS